MTKILGEFARLNFIDFQTEIREVASMMGLEEYGYLHLVCTPAQYFILTQQQVPVLEFVQDFGEPGFINAVAIEHRKRYEAKLERMQKVEKRLRTLILEAAGDDVVRAMREENINFMGMTALLMMQWLFATYGTPTAAEHAIVAARIAKELASSDEATVRAHGIALMRNFTLLFQFGSALPQSIKITKLGESIQSQPAVTHLFQQYLLMNPLIQLQTVEAAIVFINLRIAQVSVHELGYAGAIKGAAAKATSTDADLDARFAKLESLLKTAGASVEPSKPATTKPKKDKQVCGLFNSSAGCPRSNAGCWRAHRAPSAAEKESVAAFLVSKGLSAK